MITQNKIITAAEQLGWIVNIKKQKANKYHRQWYVSFSIYTYFGQDVCFEFEINRLNDLPDEIYECYMSYDPDEETFLWIGKDGHGKNGAPYYISDILKDMQEVDSKLQILSDTIYEL